MRTVLAVLLILSLFTFVEWFADITAPILGPIVLIGIIIGLITLFIKAGKEL